MLSCNVPLFCIVTYSLTLSVSSQESLMGSESASYAPSWALSCGHLAMVKRFTETPKQLEEMIARLRRSPNLRYLLGEIACSGSTESFIWALDNLQIPLDLPESATIWALKEAIRTGQVEIVMVLIDRGVDVVKADKEDIAREPWEELDCTDGWHMLETVDENSMVMQYLAAACYTGCIELVLLLMEAGLQPAVYERDTLAPLWVAARLGNLELVKLLIKNGADPNGGCYAGFPWSAAFLAGRDHIVQYFLEGVQPKEGDIIQWTIDFHQKFEGFSALDAACVRGNLEFVRFLLEQGADVNKGLPSANHFPLHLAVANSTDEDFRVVELLVQAGASVNISTVAGLTPLHCACASYRPRLMEYLLSTGADINAGSEFMESDVLILGAELGRVAPVRWLLEHMPDRQQETDLVDLLSVACGYRHLGLIKFLVEEYDVDHDPVSTLWIAMRGTNQGRRGSPSLSDERWLKARRKLGKPLEKVVLYFLNRGMDPDAKDQNGDTPLLFLMRRVDSRGRQDKTPPILIYIFLLYGASLRLSGEGGSTPLHIAVANMDMPFLVGLLEGRRKNAEEIQELIRSNELTRFSTKKRKQLQLLREAASESPREERRDVSARDAHGKTPMHFVVNDEQVNLLSSHGAAVNVVDACGRTPLFAVCAKRYFGAFRALLALGAEVNLYPHANPEWSPLAAAARADHSAMVEVLLSHGANPHVGGPNDPYMGTSFALSEDLFTSYPFAIACKVSFLPPIDLYPLAAFLTLRLNKGKEQQHI